jgi:hypothetical protein
MDVFETLRATWVCGRKLAISAEGGRRPSPGPSRREPKGKSKEKSKRRAERQAKTSSTAKK